MSALFSRTPEDGSACHVNNHLPADARTPGPIHSPTKKRANDTTQRDPRVASQLQQRPASGRLQLSERESIFAENYHHDDHGGSELSQQPQTAQGPQRASRMKTDLESMATSPVQTLEIQRPLTSSGAQSFFEPLDIFLFGGDAGESSGRNTMSMETQPQSRDAAIPPLATSKSLSDHILALPPFTSPSESPRERPSTPRTQSTFDLAPRASQTSDERLNYRSWREGLPIYGGRIMGQTESAGDETTVDSRIEATLPRTEQPNNARSRKASYMLGVFKEIEAGKKDGKAEQPQLSDKQVRDGPSARSESRRRGKRRPCIIHVTPELTRIPGRPTSPIQENSAPSNTSLPVPLDLEQARPSVYKEADKAPKFPPSIHPQTLGVRHERPGMFRRSTSDDARSVARSPARSQAQFEQTRAYSTKHKPVASSLHTQEERPNSGSDEESDNADKETISSAVYYPHHAIDQPHRPQPPVLSRSRSLSSVKAIADDRDHPEAHLRPSASTSRTESLQSQAEPEIELSIHSDHESQRLHGGLSLTNKSTLDKDKDQHYAASDSGLSVSDSEFDPSESEDTAFGGAETPKAAGMFRKSHELSQGAPQAIDLKPYPHQVGGHTSLYRFSRRAVCKKINNRENKFYETVERHHPDLLEVMPR